MKTRESIHSVFLNNAILEAGTDVDIVNAHEMLALSEVEPDIKVAYESLVFNKTPKKETDRMEALTLKNGGGAVEAKKTWCLGKNSAGER